MKKLTKIDNVALLSQAVLLTVLLIASAIALFLPGLETFITYILMLNLAVLSFNFIRIFDKKIFGIICIFCLIISILSTFGVISGI